MAWINRQVVTLPSARAAWKLLCSGAKNSLAKGMSAVTSRFLAQAVNPFMCLSSMRASLASSSAWSGNRVPMEM